MKRALGATLALSLLVPGCQLPGADSGGDGGCVDAGQTVNDQCQTVYTELCKQAARCNISIPSITECVSSDVAQYCCTGSACSAWSCQAPSQVAACTADIDNEDCNAVVNNATPATCASFTSAM